VEYSLLLDFQRIADTGCGISSSDGHGEFHHLTGREMFLQLGAERFVRVSTGSELFGIADDQMLKFAIRVWVVSVAGETIQLGLRKTNPLTEGDVQRNSILTAVELSGPQVSQLAEFAIELHLSLCFAQGQVSGERFGGMRHNFVEVENTPDNLLSYLTVFGGNLIGIEKRYEGHVCPSHAALVTGRRG
jgi:hypothetical protein